MSRLLHKLKSWLKRSDSLVGWVRTVRMRLRARRLKGPKLIRRFARMYPRAFFIQIGSNDGEQLDPLREMILSRPWRGIMVEPVPYVFERLRQNYIHLSDRIALENLAIADQEGRLPFWHLRQETNKPDYLPQWYDALGSFRKDVVLKHTSDIPDLERRLVCTEVPCLTFAGLCRKYDIDKLDLLHIDTEGYDFEIIKHVDFDRYRPKLLIYEHHHLGDATRRACRDLLQGMGYVLYEEALDTWCMDTRVQDKRHRQLLKYWKTLVNEADKLRPAT